MKRWTYLLVGFLMVGLHARGHAEEIFLLEESEPSIDDMAELPEDIELLDGTGSMQIEWIFAFTAPADGRLYYNKCYKEGTEKTPVRIIESTGLDFKQTAAVARGKLGQPYEKTIECGVYVTSKVGAFEWKRVSKPRPVIEGFRLYENGAMVCQEGNPKLMVQVECTKSNQRETAKKSKDQKAKKTPVSTDEDRRNKRERRRKLFIKD